ncbi:MAG: cupredoxin domain-containing protein [Vicinamibacterales bacterium]
MKRTLILGVLVCLAAGFAAQGKREFTVHAKRFAFTPARIEVGQDDMVKVTFTADDIAHSFTIDEYRIAKRAEAGQTVTFEFRADRPGNHPIYCNLTNDEGCKRMHGELVVKGR